jgi:hypothetical protein
MRNLVSFKEWLLIESHGLDLQELNIRGITAATAVMVILRQSALVKQQLGQVPREQFHERKLEAIAAALDALNTKTTAMAALTYGMSQRR